MGVAEYDPELNVGVTLFGLCGVTEIPFPLLPPITAEYGE